MTDTEWNEVHDWANVQLGQNVKLASSIGIETLAAEYEVVL